MLVHWGYTVALRGALTTPHPINYAQSFISRPGVHLHPLHPPPLTTQMFWPPGRSGSVNVGVAILLELPPTIINGINSNILDWCLLL